MGRIKRSLAVLLAVLLLASAVCIPAAASTSNPMKGMDVSYFQGDINFAKVKSSGIEFAILREGYRQTTDTKFFSYAKGCKDNGIPVLGVYHFSYALNAEQAKQEAKTCIQNVQKAGLGKDVIIFYDFEYDTVTKAKNQGVTLGSKQCNAFTKAFCEYVTSQGYKAGIYANGDYYKNMYDKNLLSQYVFWLADYSGSPDYSCDFHQYTSSGKVSGISGNVDLNYYYGKRPTTGSSSSSSSSAGSAKVRSRSAVVSLLQSWVGKKESDGSYKSIINIYNSYKGTFPRGTKMDYSWAWCACTWSAAAIQLGYTDIMPIEISCYYLVEAAKKKGCWVENDAFIPQPGDAILYDWDDSGRGDNTGTPDHIGTVEKVNSSARTMTIIEGNYSDSVKRRTVSFNATGIRGFITPKYTSDTGAAKSLDEVAQEVLAGLWGNAEARIAALKAAGYDPDAVQRRVNELIGIENPEPAPAPKKTVDELAQEVLDGLWGDADARIAALKAAGYDPDAVQKRVNELLGVQSPAPVPQKSVDEVAKEVLAGLWGNADARIAALKAAGYDPDVVQKRVNELLEEQKAASKKSIAQVAQEVIDGKWGTGQTRINKLKAAGYDPDTVQKKVNELLKAKATPKTYKVVRGDNLTKIAKKYGTTPSAIVKANKAKYKKITLNYIEIGWKLTIPA